jgi:6-phosphogluconolactonase
VLLLGVGEDGHVASVFPEHPVTYETRPVSAVRGCPKPPPVRTTLTLPALNTAEDVWLIVTGKDKAASVSMALEGAGPVQVPAAGVRGVDHTVWLLDRDAAANVAPRFRSLR